LEGSGAVTTSAAISVSYQGKNWNDHYPATYWEGYLKVPETGDYQFRCTSNGGIKVLLDGQALMDHWRQKWLAADDQAKVHLTAGQVVPLRIEWRTEQGSTLRLTWKTPSADKDTSFWSEMGDGVDYYFVSGPTLDRVVAGYRTLTGPAPLMPNWAFGLWQSRQRYETADDSLKVVEGFRQRGIPFDNIVQDWRYWPDGKWGSHAFDPERFPDPQAWVKTLHDQHAHVMISVWGKYYPGTDNFEAMNQKGYLYQPLLKEGIKDWLGQPYTFYDAFNPGARKLFWKQLDRDLFSFGIDAWWMDATEPDLMPSPPTLAGQETHLASTALAPGAQVMNAYPLMNSQGIYDGQRLSAPGQRVFILTRSGFAGSQRTASAIWSGDITSTWSALQKQIPAGLNMSLSGIPYWTTDIGGYTMQRKFSDKSMKSEDAEEWRELNVRWFEFGTFCPLLRVHGELRHREMWELGDAGSPAYQAELLFDRLRYRLFPYLYSWAWKVTHAGATFMRPLVMDFPDDPQVRGLTDEYMFGDSLLVCPITHYKARSRQVYLPAGTWYDLWTGKAMKPGVQEVAAPLDRMPLFVKAGAILPIGPDLQYISEKPQDPITLYVYPGADGDFTLYEDDGTTYGYEKGKYSEIPIHWDDATKTLTTGSRSGSFEGMVKGFRVVIGVGRDFPVVPNQEAPAELRTYQGEKLSVPLVDHP
jgi:alpha-D-xyloside xylohydrolase